LRGGNYQIPLRNSTQPYSTKGSNLLSSLDIKLLKIRLFTKNNDNESDTSHITIKNFLKESERYNSNIKSLQRKNKPSSKIFTFLLNKSQEIINNFMQQRKSKHNEKQQDNIRNVLSKNLQKVEYNETRNKKFLNLDNPEDIETDFKILERSNSKEKKNRKLSKSLGLQITEKIF